MPSIFEQAWAALEPALGPRDDPNEGVTTVNYAEAQHIAMRLIIGQEVVGGRQCTFEDDDRCRQCSMIGHKVCDLVMKASNANR